MTSKRFTDECKTEAVKQVSERSCPVAERLGVSSHSFYIWLQESGVGRDAQSVKISRSGAGECSASCRATSCRRGSRHLKIHRVLCQGIREKNTPSYRLIADSFASSRSAACLSSERSGYYAWLKQPLSPRAKEDARLMVHIDESYLTSGGVYDSRNVHRDLIEVGERISRKRVGRLMHKYALRSVRSPLSRRYKERQTGCHRVQSAATQLTVEQPDRAQVTDTTYLRTAEGWLYLTIVIDLYSRAMIGWSIKSSLARKLTMDTLLMAIWRRRPASEVVIHSDQACRLA